MTKISHTQSLMATTCKHTGKTCPALSRMAEKLAQAMEAARPMTAEDFEIAGNSVLKHCPQHCPAYFHASHDRIRIFAGIAEGANTIALDQMADAMFDAGHKSGFAATQQKAPCAMVEIRPQMYPSDLLKPTPENLLHSG
ncbi:hypothetical protein [Phaeobacter sp. NW0010-22]|uniref:hypothetical protein n=1 Tax=Phaeobacter sp. NW0010-22 TaxID=3135907 RepID=UPI003109748F